MVVVVVLIIIVGLIIIIIIIIVIIVIKGLNSAMPCSRKLSTFSFSVGIKDAFLELFGQLLGSSISMRGSEASVPSF